jgi:BlaI family penicillinase repressor
MTKVMPTDRELEALKVLWDNQQATVREICDTINSKGEQLAYTTVLSLLQVMEQKGLVGHKRVGKSYSYHAKIRRDSTFRRLAGGFVEKVFDGAVDQFVLHAIQSQRISSEELERLEQLLDQVKQQTRLAERDEK